MTRKHFEAFAAALANIRPNIDTSFPPNIKTHDSLVLFNSWKISVDQIANVCAELNPRFDRERFIAATNA